MVDTEFLDALASKAPTPGGGGASAYCGALAAALATMVGNLTVGKKRYAEVEDLIYSTMEELESLREDLLELIEEDAEAFLPLAAAYKLPKNTPEEAAIKEAAMQDALVGAIEAPLEIMKACCRVITLTEVMAQKGSGLAISDAGAAAVFANAALRGASLNALINARDLKDEDLGRKYSRKADEMLAIYGPKAEAIIEYVFWRVKYT